MSHDHEYIAWVALIAYSLHVLEEYMLDWKNWANRVLKLPVDWGQFYVTNAVVIAAGIGMASIGWHRPEITLLYPALMVINGLFFHVLPTICTAKFSPGLITAVVLFFPVAAWEFAGARSDGALNVRTAVIAFIGGAILMAFPVVMLKVKDRPFFRQT